MRVLQSTLTVLFVFFALYTNAQNVFPENGNVGVGTTTPIYKLDIAGDMQLTKKEENPRIHFFRQDWVEQRLAKVQQALK